MFWPAVKSLAIDDVDPRTPKIKKKLIAIRTKLSRKIIKIKQ